MVTSKPTFFSIFSGCGGFDLGFVDAGFTCLGAVDINPTVLAVHSSNFQSPTYCADLSIGKLPFDHKIATDVLLAGSPCQGFSTAGKRDIDDPRNSLLLAAGKVAIRKVS
ncbi:MAG: DNA cytosine methyltransferase [Nitrospinae bacterium]|nr:DNA cytosine methyltransferase [Nitrospinota bacterium]